MSSLPKLVTDCAFELNIIDSIPSDSKLTESTSRCAMQEANSISIGTASDGACYAEVSIDYNTKKISVKLTHTTMLKAWSSPYDDMLGMGNGLRSVVQYKIEGNLDKDTVRMTTRFHCKTYDNCALDKLRKLLSNLTISDVRLKIFKDLIKLINVPDLNATSDLACMHDTDVVQCSATEDRCLYDRSKNKILRQGCATQDSSASYNIEYRFNVLEEMAQHGTDNSANAFKLSYLCIRDHCNDECMIKEVDYLLNSFAMGNINVDKTPIKPNPQQQQQHHGSTNVNAQNGFSDFYSCNRLIILVSLTIVFFSNRK